MSLSPLEHIILLSLNQNKGGYAVFPLFKIAKVPMAEFMRTLSALKQAGFVRLTESKVILESVGFNYLMRSRPRVVEGLRCAIPPRMQRNHSVAVGAPYVPAISRLDKKLFLNEAHATIRNEGGQ